MNISSATGRRAACGADDGGLGDGGIDHPALAETICEPRGDTVDPAVLPVGDVLAHHDHALVPRHLLVQHLVDRLADRQFAHAGSPR